MSKKEMRKVHLGATYWLRRIIDLSEGVQWIITADGVALCSPTTYELAREGFEALTQ